MKGKSTFSNGQPDTTTLGKRDPRLIPLANDKHISLPRSKSMIGSILDVNDIIPPMMSFTMRHNANTPNVVPGGDHGDIPDIKFDVASDFPSFKVVADCVADFDGGIGVADCSGIVGDEVGDALGTELDAFDFAKFVFSFFGGDAVDCEAAFYVVDQTKVLVCLVDCDDISTTRQHANQ
jgi:hypothetical protein